MTEIKKHDFEKKLSGLLREGEKEKIMLAYKFAELGHKGQIRDEGGPYFEHPKRAALILIDELRIADVDMIVAELLHDIKEESTILSWEEIELFFGKSVKEIIKAVTKKDKSKPISLTFPVFIEPSEEEKRKEKEVKEKWAKEYLENIKKGKEKIRLVKLADRLDNLRTLRGCSKTKQSHIIRETQEYYLSMAKETSPYIFEKMEEIIKNFGFTDFGTQIKNILSFPIPCGYEGCGKEAIHIDVDERGRKVKVINREAMMEAEDIKKLIYLLKHDVGKVDSFLRSLKKSLKKSYSFYIFEDGLYNFCQQCDCAYCDEHHDSRIVWEEEGAWYDYTLWKCPKGHEHIVDD